MIGQNELIALAEIGVGLVGFSGVVFAIRRRDEAQPWSNFRALALITTSFLVLFLALLPLAVHAFGLSGPTLWRLSSAAALVLALSSVVAVFLVMPDGFRSSNYFKQVATANFVFSVPATVLLGLNTFAIGTEGSFAFYFLAVFLTLFTTVPQFVVVLLSPSRE
jgi:hypothetical protein